MKDTAFSVRPAAGRLATATARFVTGRSAATMRHGQQWSAHRLPDGARSGARRRRYWPRANDLNKGRHGRERLMSGSWNHDRRPDDAEQKAAAHGFLGESRLGSCVWSPPHDLSSVPGTAGRGYALLGPDPTEAMVGILLTGLGQRPASGREPRLRTSATRQSVTAAAGVDPRIRLDSGWSGTSSRERGTGQCGS